MKIRTSMLASLAAASLLFFTGCETTSPSSSVRPGGAVSAYFKKEDVRKMAVLVPGGRGNGHDAVIENVFLDVLLSRNYDLVTRQSLEHVAKELVRTRDEAFDNSTAAEIGKLANASHIVVVRMPMIQEKYNRETRSRTYDVSITAQVIEVQSGRIVMVAQDRNSMFDSIITINGGPDPASVVEKVARKVAMKFP